MHWCLLILIVIIAGLYFGSYQREGFGLLRRYRKCRRGIRIPAQKAYKGFMKKARSSLRKLFGYLI